MSLQRDIERLSHDYVRKGGKQNRRKQAKRMIALGACAEKIGCRHIGELGKRHVIEFYKSHRELSDAVQYQYWLSFRELWRLSNKPSDPPTPFTVHQPRAAHQNARGGNISKIDA